MKRTFRGGGGMSLILWCFRHELILDRNSRTRYRLRLVFSNSSSTLLRLRSEEVRCAIHASSTSIVQREPRAGEQGSKQIGLFGHTVEFLGDALPKFSEVLSTIIGQPTILHVRPHIIN